MTRAQRTELTLEGFTTSFLTAGDPDAPPVVLLHDGAWGGSAEASWAAVIPKLAHRYRVIAPDLYGYGRSSKMVQLDVAPFEFRLRQVAGLLDALGGGNRAVHLIGNSFGGAMALRATTLPWFSWRVRSAISIAGTGGPYRSKEAMAALATFDGTRPDMMRIVRLITGEFDGIDAHVDLRMRDAGNPAHFRSVAAAGLETPFVATTKEADEYPANLREVTVPLALVSGLADTLVESDWARLIAQNAPTCSIHEHPGHHAPNISDPVATAQLLLDILGSHEAQLR